MNLTPIMVRMQPLLNVEGKELSRCIHQIWENSFPYFRLSTNGREEQMKHVYKVISGSHIETAKEGVELGKLNMKWVGAFAHHASLTPKHSYHIVASNYDQFHRLSSMLEVLARIAQTGSVLVLLSCILIDYDSPSRAFNEILCMMIIVFIKTALAIYT